MHRCRGCAVPAVATMASRTCGQVAVPWTRERSGFSLPFEAMVVTLKRAMCTDGARVPASVFFHLRAGQCHRTGEKVAGKQGALVRRLATLDVVIPNQLGYLPFSQADGALLFHRDGKLYEHASLVITTNLSVGFRVRRPQDDHRLARPVTHHCPTLF